MARPAWGAPEPTTKGLALWAWANALPPRRYLDREGLNFGGANPTRRIVNELVVGSVLLRPLNRATKMSTTSLSRAQSAGSFTPGRDSARLKTSIASGFGASHTEWVPTSNPVMSRKVEGPPHIGRREDLLKENKALHKALEAKTVECQHAERILEELGASRENERGKWSAEHVRLANEIGELVSRASARRAAFSSLLPRLIPSLPPSSKQSDAVPRFRH